MVTEEVFNEEINKRPIAYPAVIEDGVIIEPGKKIDASLIDAEWLATSIKADLDITISNKNADSFEVIEVLGVPMMTKLSDTAPTLEQLKSSIITITASDGASQEIKITTDMIVQDPEVMGNAYIVYDMLLIYDKEVTDPDMGVTLNKGIYLGETIPGALEHFGATSINLYIPDGLSSINLLPEKFIPDTIARVSDVKEETSAKINELKASGGIGYTESAFVLTYDGRGGESKQVDDFNYTKINQKGFDLRLVEKIAGRFMVSAEDIELTSDLFEVEGSVEFIQGLVAPQLTNGNVIALVISIDEGVFVIDDETFGGYVSRIYFSEQVHTIDPKYLPNGIEKTLLFDGTPTKMDLSSVGLGYAYLCSASDLVSIAKGQNVHYEFTIDDVKYSGIMDNVGYNPDLTAPYLHDTKIMWTGGANIGYPLLVYESTLGGTGFSLFSGTGRDVGDITNIKLWTEYTENELYFITGYNNGSNVVFFSVDQDKAIRGARNLKLAVKYLDSGDNVVYLIPSSFTCDFNGQSCDVLLHNIESA